MVFIPLLYPDNKRRIVCNYTNLGIGLKNLENTVKNGDYTQADLEAWVTAMKGHVDEIGE